MRRRAARPRPRVSARGPSRVRGLSPRLELGAAVRAAQSQRDDGPRADGGEPRGVRRGRAPGRARAAADQFASQLHAAGSSISASSVWVTRKGAIEARTDNWAMIPGSMGTRSYIVVGKENPMSFHSAPHGAGRRYSRTKARSALHAWTTRAGRWPASNTGIRRCCSTRSRRVQGHRRSDGAREGSRRGQVRAEAVRQREGRLIAATHKSVRLPLTLFGSRARIVSPTTRPGSERSRLTPRNRTA